MSTSHYSSRPAQTDIGADTIRVPLEGLPANRRKHIRLVANLWLMVGVMLLLCDGGAMVHFADSPIEAFIIAALSMPTGILVILAALQARK